MACLVSQNVSHAVSALQSIVCLYIFLFFVLLIRSLADRTLAALIVCGPLQFLVSHLLYSFILFCFVFFFSEYVFLLCEEMGLPAQTRFLALEIFDRQVKTCCKADFNIFFKENPTLPHFPKAVNFWTTDSSHRFMAKHICDLYELIRSNSETNLLRNWTEVENRIKTQLPLRVMSCVQLASKLTSHYKVKSSACLYHKQLYIKRLYRNSK